VLPGARAVLFTVVEHPWNWEAARVVVHRFGTKGWQVLLAGAADARYVPTGHLIYFRRGRLMAVPFDLERLEKTGSEVGLITDVMQSTNGLNTVFDLGAAQVATAATGTLAYVAGGEMPDVTRQLIWVDRRGQVEPLSAPPRPYYASRVSPDGQHIALTTLQSQRRIWVHDVRVPGSLVPVTSPELEAFQPAWRRDGERLAFNGAPAGRSGLFWTQADGTQPPQRLSTADGYQTPASWTPDGHLLYVQEPPFDIWLLSRHGDGWTGKALLASKDYEGDAQVSPDGRWIAYTSDETGRAEVYVRQFPSLAGRRPVSTEGGREPVWARNGRELFYLRGSGPSTDTLEMVVHDVGSDGAIAPAGRPLFRLGPIRAGINTPVPGFDVTPDGKRFIFPQFSDTSLGPPPKQIHVVFNWFEELKAKVPTGK
jgi:serine/threonine-protein kinase